MPFHLISPPAVQRVAPLSKPLGSTLSHVSAAPSHVVVVRTLDAPPNSTLAASKTPAPAPAHVVSQAKTY